MATTENALSGIDGTKKKFPFTFPYLKTTDLKVELVRTTTADSTTTTTTLDSTEFTFPTATEVELSAYTDGDTDSNDVDRNTWQEYDTGAPKANGDEYTYSGKVYRSTSSDALAATFYPGSAIRSADLNDNYTQNLYVTQEANNNVTTATTDAAAAVVTADAADANATSALNNSRESDGEGGYNSAISIANTASTNAANAVITADSAESAVSSVLPFTIVTNKAALLAASVTQDDIYEVTDTTDLEDLGGEPAGGDPGDVIWVNAAGSTSGQDIAALKPNVTWDSGITLKMKKYGTSDSDRKWIFQSYFANDPETKYAPTASPTFTGTPTAPTASTSTNTTQIATTAFVVAEIADEVGTTVQAYDADLTALSSCQTGAATALALLTSTEVGALDITTAGTAEASKAVVLDGNKDITGLNDVTIAGNLTVGGTTTEVNSQTLTVDDKNIELGSVSQQTGQTATLSTGTAVITVTSTTGYLVGATLTKTAGSGAFNASGVTIASVDSATQITASADHQTLGAITFTVGGATDVTANGGGITLKGGSDKTILWTDSTDSWDFNQDIKTSGTVTDSEGNVRNIPASTNSTLVAADAGKHISITAGITINASTDFAIGDAVTIFNNQGDGNDELITATGITLYLASDATGSGNRTLAGRGVATILCVATDTYVITGAGLS